MKRTEAEITARYRHVQPDDLLGFKAEVLLPFVSSDAVKEFLRPGADGWEAEALTREALLADMEKYMEFAWAKVQNHRGISATRSVAKMEEWLWLLGDDSTLAAVESASYTNYGAPKLHLICEKYGFPIPEDDGVRKMARGLPCRDGCDEGCGR